MTLQLLLFGLGVSILLIIMVGIQNLKDEYFDRDVPDPRQLPWQRIEGNELVIDRYDDDPKKEVEKKSQESKLILEGYLFKKFYRYSDSGLLIDKDNNRLFWPSKDGTYNLKDEYFPDELREQLIKINDYVKKQLQ